jgi:hypothetical protein
MRVHDDAPNLARIIPQRDFRAAFVAVIAEVATSPLCGWTGGAWKNLRHLAQVSRFKTARGRGRRRDATVEWRSAPRSNRDREVRALRRRFVA